MLSGSTRTRALLIYKDEILLVRNWLGTQQWSLPGGGVGNNETSRNGMQRELREELGIDIRPKHYQRLLKTRQKEHGAEFVAIVFQINLKSRVEFQIEKNELIEASWHKVSSLPDNLHPLVVHALKIKKK